MSKYIILRKTNTILEITIELNGKIVFYRRFMGYSRRDAEKIARTEAGLNNKKLIRIEY